MSCTRLAGFAFVVLALATRTAVALPAYAQKEGKACGFCHVSPSGGGSLNATGLYYVTHKHSLDGYVDPSAGSGDSAKKTGPPAFASLWKMDVEAGVTRVASAVVTDDKKPRLLVLGADNVLKIKNLSGKEPVDDGSIDLGAGGPRFAVGRFAPEKPAVIAEPGAVWYRDGDHYSSKKVAKLTDVSGSVCFCDATAIILNIGGTSPHSLAIDLSASGDDVLKDGKALVKTDQAAGVYSNVLVRAGDDAMRALGFPEQVRKAGVAGVFDPRDEKKAYVWTPTAVDDGFAVVVADIAYLADPTKTQPLWQSPKQAGKILDVFYGPDPKGGKLPGLLVLSATGSDGKGRSLEFFSLG